MSAFLQTVDGDFAISGARLAITEDLAEEVRQRIRSRLRVFRGEWFLDIEAGTPYYQEILGKMEPRAAEAALQAVIAETPGVQEILEFDFELDSSTRVATVTFRVSTTEGVVEGSEEI